MVLAVATWLFSNMKISIDSTHSFLDDFAREMDQRMEEMDNRIRRMENALSLVEFKLNSVPDLGSEDVVGAGTEFS